MRTSQRRERKEDESFHAQGTRVPVGSAMVNGLHFEEGFLALSSGFGVTLGRLPSFLPNHAYRGSNDSSLVELPSLKWNDVQVCERLFQKRVPGQC